MNVSDFILSRGNDTAPALFHLDTVVTYAELRREVARLTSGLSARSRPEGQRIGVCSENSPFFVSAYLGIIGAGLVAVPLSADLSAESFAKVVRDAGIRELFVSRRFHRRLKPWAEVSGVVLLVEGDLDISAIPETGASGFSSRDCSFQHSACNSENAPSSLASLMFTSGSTGAPRGVMVTHRNIESNTRDIVAYMALTTADRAMVVLPFHYCFGLSVLHSLLAAGGSLVLNNQCMYPESVLADMVGKACTGLAGVPSTYQFLLRKSRFKEMQFPALRWLQQAGGKLPNSFIREIQEAFPQVSYYLMYGQTEATARLSYLPPGRLRDKLGSIGQGLPSTRLAVLKPDGTTVTPGSDEVGEIVAFGPNVTLGYWHDPEETARYFRSGGLYTGDLARVDSDGFIFIVDREREMIKSGGNRVSAKEVEDIISELPEVVEVAVVGVSHELLGEAIQAFVVVTEGAVVNPSEIMTHCQRRLPAYKRPESVKFLPALPHNSVGKVLKGKLKPAGPVGAAEEAIK